MIYALSQAWCNSNQDGDFDLLEKYLQNLKPEEMILVRGAALQGTRRRPQPRPPES